MDTFLALVNFYQYLNNRMEISVNFGILGSGIWRASLSSSLKYCIGGVIVSMLASSAVDRGFELGSKERL